MRSAVVVAAVLLVASTACFEEPRMFREDLVEVPDVTGRAVGEAQEDLYELGFGVRVVTRGDEEVACPGGTVVSQDPGAGAEELRAATVTLVAEGC